MVKPTDMVVTSKGNYGRVISVGTSTAMVRIGYKTHEIEIYNLINVTDGLHLKISYSVAPNNDSQDELLFVKHGTILFDLYDSEGTTKLLKVVENSLSKKLNISNLKILKIQIP